MLELIGKTLIYAVDFCSEKGYDYVIINYDSDKLESSDTTLVVRAKIKNNVIELTTSKFLLEI